MLNFDGSELKIRKKNSMAKHQLPLILSTDPTTAVISLII